MMEDDRGDLERRLLQFEDALIVGTVTTDGERDYARKLLFEAADTIGSARWAIGQALRQVARMTPAVDPDAPSGGLADQCDCVRALLRYALESLKGGG